jgi:hypothetical protein
MKTRDELPAIPAALLIPIRPPASCTDPRRERLERALERLEDLRQSLILKLDEQDGDPDFEDDDPAEDNGDAEPSLGFLEPNPKPRGGITQGNICQGVHDDLEEEHDGLEPDADEEPSLGFLEPLIPVIPWAAPEVGQERLCWGGTRDLEDEHDGREHSLGWSHALDWTCTHSGRCTCGAPSALRMRPSPSWKENVSETASCEARK